MGDISFKERVRNAAINEAKKYKKTYVDFEYLVCSEAFNKRDFYIIDAKEDNYQHLIGINSQLTAKEFFARCYNSTLDINDFDFNKKHTDEKSVKGSVRRKISVLPNIYNLFTKDTLVEESFKKNTDVCHFATSDNKCTLGFIAIPKSRPKSLLKGNNLDKCKMKHIDLILKKSSNNDKFNEIIVGNIEVIYKYFDRINNYIDDELTIGYEHINIDEINKQVAIENLK